MKETIKEKIVRALKAAGEPLAEFEFPYLGTTGSCLTRRLRELREAGIVQARRRVDVVNREVKRFNEWYLIEKKKDDCMTPRVWNDGGCDSCPKVETCNARDEEDKKEQDLTNSDCDKNGKYKYRGV